jgi:hypothetical protein
VPRKSSKSTSYESTGIVTCQKQTWSAPHSWHHHEKTTWLSWQDCWPTHHESTEAVSGSMDSETKTDRSPKVHHASHSCHTHTEALWSTLGEEVITTPHANLAEWIKLTVDRDAWKRLGTDWLNRQQKHTVCQFGHHPKLGACTHVKNLLVPKRVLLLKILTWKRRHPV